MRTLLPLCIAATTLTLSAQGPHVVKEWLTTPDRKSLMTQQPGTLTFKPAAVDRGSPAILVDDAQTLQTLDGFGFALTGGSAELLMRMTSTKRHALLQELFGTSGSSIGVSYLRLSIGSSDMNERVFTYDDMPPGKDDLQLRHFQLGPDLNDVVPVLNEILKIDPSISILGTPWSAPSWMKTNDNPKAGSLKPEDYTVYAQYLARYVQAMAAHGIHIHAITPQNEPLNANNTPSMVVTAEEEAAFIEQALGPVFRDAHLDTKIIVYDHNCDRPDYPLTIFADKAAAQFVDGSGFHLYEGSIDAMSKVHEAYPTKNLYFTEQMVIDDPRAGPELRIADPVSNIVIGATSNWSRNVLLWNLAADPRFGPHTSDGGCPVCEGAITLDGDTVTRNAAYYTIAHISRFVRPGAVRIGTSEQDAVPPHVAFRNKDGHITLLVANPSGTARDFTIGFHGEAAHTSLAAGAVATYVW